MHLVHWYLFLLQFDFLRLKCRSDFVMLRMLQHRQSISASVAHRQTIISFPCLLIKRRFGSDTVRMIRFLGTSPKSTSIRETIISLCHQICETYDVNFHTELDIGKDFSYLALYFTALLRNIDTQTTPLVIILDSVDQLVK